MLYPARPVPANPHAIMEAKSAGINTRPLTKWVKKTLADPPLGYALICTDPKTCKIYPRNVKSGRVLSAANEELLRNAYDKIGQVLKSLDSRDSGKSKSTIDIDDEFIRNLKATLREMFVAPSNSGDDVKRVYIS